MSYTRVTMHKERDGMFVVSIEYRPPFEDMFETVKFAGRFEARLDAERLASRVNEAIAKVSYPFEAIDKDRWIWDSSPCSPLGFIQNRPKAKPFTIPASKRAKATNYID